MTRTIFYICFLLLAGTTSLFAQSDTIRYVKTTGSYTNNGRSWAAAKSDLQGAINDLKEYLDEYGLTSGSIYVAAGTYTPTETTEPEGGGLQYTAFKIYPGIHLYGGFAADESRDDASPYNPDGSVDETYRPLDHSLSSLESGQEAKPQPWNFLHKTVLSGTHYTVPTFTYDQEHGTFSTIFPGNSYHVVWFATEGFIPVTVEGDQVAHALPLPENMPASVDGCRITGGYAASKTTTDRLHSAYGGGAYLVANATLSRCVVDHCEAIMRGGGVYLDGGGLVDNCFIHTCQSPGVGIMQGYGGGACIDYDGAVIHSYIVNNCSRIGGGVAICHAPDEYPWQSLDAWRVANGGTARGEINVYSPHATACIISNNTTTAEGGGIYFYDGGVGNHLTVTHNRCVGQDITYYGRRHGRSGGVYILNGGHIYNSVFWGNKCEANSDIQFASHISGSTDDVVDPSTGNIIKEGLKPLLYYSAIEKHDITDWAGTAKQSVMSLESENTNPGGTNANYPYFIGSDGQGKMMGYAGAGLNIELPMGTVDSNYDPTVTSSDLSVNPHNVPDPNATGIPRPIYWKPAAITSMAKKGLQVTDALHLTSEWIRHAHTATDLFADKYEPMSTFGALTRRNEQLNCVLVANQEIALYSDKGYTQAKVDAYNDAVVADAQNSEIVLPIQLPDDGSQSELPTIFVDPSRNAGQAGITIGQQNIGTSWTYPAAHINDAIHFFRQRQWAKGTANEFWYNIGGTSDGAGGFTGGTDYPYVQILVKGFERGSGIYATTAGLDAYLGTQLRTAAIRPASNMRIYGGYLPTSTGIDASQRNARTYPTMLTANITNTGYENNSAHVLALINVKNVIIDGLRLNEGNANLNEEHSYAPIDPETGEPEHITYGGGLIVNNTSVPKSERIDMTGNIFRNSYIANCSAPNGAAVYVNSSNKKANGEYSRAELNIINTIIRNNSVGDGTHDISAPGFGDAGVITACGGKAIIRLDHCDIVNNCGYALETLSTETGEDYSSSNTPNPNEGTIRIYNSVIYANGKIDRDNRKRINQPLSCRSQSNSQNNVDGDYIFLDWDAPKPKNLPHCYAVFCRDMSEQYQKWAIRKMDIYQQTVMTGDTPEVYYFDTEADAEAYIAAHPSSGDWTWCKIKDPNDPTQQIEGPIQLDYPFFENPSKNVGHSTEGDKPMNGGIVSYMPQNKNPMINAAVAASRDLWDSDNYVRTRGGDPDIGAIEGRTLPEDGTIIYVTPEGAGRRDGSSWGNAIQGNAIYALSGGAAGSDVLDAQNGARITNTDPAIGSLSGNGVPTTDIRYSGGFGRVWMTDWKTGGSTNTTITQTWLTEKNVYDNGARMGEEEILHDGSTPTEETNINVVSPGTTAPGFTTAGYYNDPNFPYGEISGASRSFWRANPYHSGTDWNNAANYTKDQLADFIAACNTNGWICNTRAENYVGGLQYAVEKAATYNALDANDPGRIDGVDAIQVWVGNGTYNDYKGFVMRDKTTIMGGFPVDAYGTPGLDERQALMTATLNIPKSKKAKDFKPEDYETILQISDVDPKQDNDHLNANAVKFWDDDYSLLERSDTKTTEYKNRTLIHHFKWGLAEGSDVISNYLTYPTFNVLINNNFTYSSTSEEGGYKYYTFGAEVEGKDRWHLKHPIKTNYVVNIENSNNNKNKQRTIYDPATNQKLKNGNSDVYFTGNWIFLGNGSMTGTEFWQTMPNVPAGKYRLYVDMAGGYRNKFSSTDPTNIFFKIIAADGTTNLITPVMLKTIGSYSNSNDTGTNRNMAYRYALDFTQLADGDITIKIVVEDGVRNTKAANATYGTDDGGDPDEIPESYANNYGGSNPNRREFWMSNLKLLPITEGYEEDMASLEDQVTTRQPSETVTEAGTLYTSQTHRTTLRKRVLTMPDVCVPTYGAGSVGDPTATNRGKFEDNLSHTDRVKKDSRTSTTLTKQEDPHYVEYDDVIWDGFTIRHGFISEEAMAHGGGAGVNMYEGAHLRNCIIVDNMSYCERVKGAGIFCDGSNSSIEGCFVLNNTSTHGKIRSNDDQKQVFAGGMFLYEGTCFNSLFANNYSHGSAGGVGFCVGRFFNNTIAYNDCALEEGGHKNGGAISIATSSNPNLFIANTIIYGNTGMAIRERYDQNININAVNPFINCYVQNEVAFTQNIYKKNINNYSTSGNYGIGNTLLDGVAPSAANTPFAADLEGGVYNASNPGAKVNNDFRLTLSNNYCVNQGTEDFTGSLKDVLKRKRNWNDATVESQFIYQSVSAVQLPSNDVVYADRIQDCQIDIGAYEFDGTQEIKPGYELIAFDPEAPDNRELCAVYYVDGGGNGLATGQSPDDAACQKKLQHILDAAGLLKMDLAAIKAGTFNTDKRYSTQNVNLTSNVSATYEEIYLDGGTKKVRQVTVNNNDLADVAHVIVKVAEGIYYPIRSTNQKMVTGDAEEVLPTRSIAIPHGVEVMGGYLPYGDEHPFYETYRDPLNHKTIFSGQVEDTKTGNYGRAYHVVSFTNDLFWTDDLILSKDIGEASPLSGENALATLTDRAVIDGIAIEDGMANGTDAEDKGGGAAVVTDFAHVRNCILQDNEATFYGGALFLQPGALVSGCVMLNNEAEYGGAVYVEEPTQASLSGLTEAERDLRYARIYNSTIVRNNATVRGGGIWYETNIRAKGVCLWWNSSNDMNNVAGVFDTEKLQTEQNYPFAYCAVQSRRLPGVNNIELQPDVSHGVRWTTNSNDDMRWRGDKPTYSSQTNKDAYYYIERLSLLVRSGMPYQLYKNLRTTFPSLELRDMAGVTRMIELYDEDDQANTISYLKNMTMTPETKDNAFIEIGARVLNYQAASHVNRPFTRIYVASPQFVNNEAASRLLACADPLYSQPGSSMANPFQKLSDAFDYIIELRNSEKMASHGTTFADADAFNIANAVGTLYTRSGTEGSYTYTEATSFSSGTTYFRQLKDIYCDTRFEVFISGGTYYPYHDSHGVEGHARSSTFVIPEGVTVVGGLDPDVYYCQDGYNFDYLQPMAGDDILNYDGNEHPDLYYSGQSSVCDYRSNARTSFRDKNNNDIPDLSDITLVPAIPVTIWENRPYADINGNNVYEPWEFLHSTTLSGHTPRGTESTDNVYHVITCFADPKYVGKLPKRYSSYNENKGHVRFSGLLDEERGGTEDSNSEMHRTIILSGLNISDGNARDFDSEAVSNLSQYYRGGGLMVDGSWTDGDANSGQTDPDEKGKRNIPFYVAFSQFQNNNAVQGGAIFTNGTMNIFNCSFVQNYAKGPTANPTQTAADKDAAQGVIQYNGGGAIATNDALRCCNSIFANNEAMLGDWSDKMEGTALGWDKQGFGGTIWGGLHSNVRLMNCNVVMNKAVSYPGVFINPVQASANPWNRFCVNTIFWGNEATGVTNSSFTGITDINRDVFSYRTQANKEIEQALVEKFDRGETLTPEEDAQFKQFAVIQPMFFCAYRLGYGPPVVRTQDNLLNSEWVTADGKVKVHGATRTFAAYNYANSGKTYDPHEVPFLGEDIEYFEVFSGNNNINLTFENEGVNGPNFVLPSTIAGKDGYNPSANWMPARINNLTDNGWSYMTLTSKTATGDIEFKQIPDPANPSSYNGETNTGGIAPETPGNMPVDGITGGPYPFYSWQQGLYYKLTLMPYGDQHYMRYKNTNMTDATTNGESNILRISSNPLTFEEAKAYIDLGVYEYQHRNLRINQSSEIDLLWVSAKENLDKGNDGYTWETPTSNLQAAIETLLKSRNDHAKQINIIGGEYKPAAVLGDGVDRSLSFTIQTRPYNNGAFTPRTNQDYGVRSLKFRGGYDLEIPEELGYDFTKNKVILSVEERTSITANQLNHVVNILDVEQYSTTVSESDGKPNSVSRGVAIPITFEGITFNNELANQYDATSNKGGAAIYYKQQYKYDDATNSKSTTDLLAPPALCQTVTTHNSTTGEDETSWIWEWDNQHWQSSWNSLARDPKLTIRNCTFTQNGKAVTNPTSAVLIEGGGGESLVVNSLFEHNAGAPLEAVNTTVVNSTFGLNGGHLTLTETTENGHAYNSALHNSVIWHDDQNNSTPSTPITKDAPGTQYSGVSSGPHMTYNAITGLLGGDLDAVDAQYNYGLSDVNSEVMTGPNFVDPENGDFSLKPSKKLMNTGHNATYASFVWPQPEYAAESEYKALMQNRHPGQNTPITRTTVIRVGSDEKTVTYTILKATNDNDLGFANRLIGETIDRGAYECAISGQRVIYVDLTKTPGGTETGKNWEEAYGYGQLQKAIDAATIYASNGSKKAYVFVKGQAGTSNEETLTVRDGVDVYGSIQNSSTSEAIPYGEPDGVREYTEQEIEAFINRVKTERQGLAVTTTNTSCIRGVISSSGNYAQGAIIDGFVISNRATTAAPSPTPAVDITIPKIALRNSIITDNVMGSGQPVVNLEGGSGTDENSLLYNTLFYGNKAGTLVNVGTNGYVLNCTIVAENNGETMLGGTNGSNPNHVKNTIAVNEYSGRGTMFAPYLRPNANVYTLPTVLTQNQPYWYQLHEEATGYINMGEDDNGAGTGNTVQDGGNAIAKLFPSAVNFAQDRDLLGNPRRLGGRVDNGCYETWKITDNRYATNETNPKASLNKYVSDVDSTDPSFDDALMVPKNDYWTDNYGGHLYPHPGSVVYVMESGNLVFDVDGSNGNAPRFNSPVRPGYVLVKDGGSIYGQGNPLRFSYVAAEKQFTAGTHYSLMAFPHNVNLAATMEVTESSGALTQTEKRSTFTPYTYDGAARSAWNYDFQADDSQLWQEYTSQQITGTEGWLLDFGTALTPNQTLRFTGWGTVSGSNVGSAYAESGDTKVVTLTQYDAHPNDGTAHFTKAENMGWNLKGAPLFISKYKTGGTNPDFQMNVPHVFYHTLTNTYVNNTAHATYGQFYTAQSWTSGATLSPGDGFFTQTAVIGNTEDLKFKIPMFDGVTQAAVKELLTVTFTDEDGMGDAVQMEADEEAEDLMMPYRINSDGIKWLAYNKDVPQLWLQNSDNTPFSLAAHAPTETPIPVGIRAAQEGRYTFSLLDNEAADEISAVWLIDSEKHSAVNLKETAYEFDNSDLSAAAASRFFIQLGGERPEAAPLQSSHQYKVFVRDRVLHVMGTQVGDQICVYLPGGELYVRDEAVNDHWRTQLRQRGIYLVRINKEAHKVITP